MVPTHHLRARHHSPPPPTLPPPAQLDAFGADVGRMLSRMDEVRDVCPRAQSVFSLALRCCFVYPSVHRQFLQGIAAWSQSGDRRRHFTSPPRPPVQLVSGLPECSTSEREQLERIEEAERENRAATAELRAATEEAESVVEGIRSRGRQINQQVAQPFVLLSPRYWLLNRTPPNSLTGVEN